MVLTGLTVIMLPVGPLSRVYEAAPVFMIVAVLPTQSTEGVTADIMLGKGLTLTLTIMLATQAVVLELVPVTV